MKLTEATRQYVRGKSFLEGPIKAIEKLTVEECRKRAADELATFSKAEWDLVDKIHNCRCVIGQPTFIAPGTAYSGVYSYKVQFLTDKKEIPMAPTNKKQPKFYVASLSITKTLNPEAMVNQDAAFREARAYEGGGADNYVKFTEKEAIDQAKALVEKDGTERYVVKIVRRVRRAPRPVVVESV